MLIQEMFLGCFQYMDDSWSYETIKEVSVEYRLGEAGEAWVPKVKCWRESHQQRATEKEQ